MLSAPAPSLATPLGVPAVAATTVSDARPSSWRAAARLAGRVATACAAALAAGVVVSLGVAGVFLLIAAAAS